MCLLYSSESSAINVINVSPNHKNKDLLHVRYTDEIKAS